LKRLLVVILFALGSGLACITGSSVPTANCAAVTTGGCSCTSIASGQGNGYSCPANDAGSATVCCAEVYFPEFENRKCTCTPLTVGCETDTGSYCECHRTYDATKPTVKACTEATKWAVCCKGLFGGCFCDANPNVSCVLSSDTIAKCDATIASGARCILTPDGTCSCDPSNKTGTATCPPPPPLVCCLNDTEGWCRCAPGGTCPSGSKGVPACTTDVVAPVALAAASCGGAGDSRVKSCNPLAK